MQKLIMKTETMITSICSKSCDKFFQLSNVHESYRKSSSWVFEQTQKISGTIKDFE